MKHSYEQIQREVRRRTRKYRRRYEQMTLTILSMLCLILSGSMLPLLSRAGMASSTVPGGYSSVLLHSEADFDRFDQVFLEFFKDVKHVDEVPPEMLKWLEHPELDMVELERLSEITGLSVEEIEKMFAERLQGQDAEHNGGRKWVGTEGYTPFGHRGKQLGGIRVGGKSNYRSAYRVAGERKYREKNGRKNGRISKKE